MNTEFEATWIDFPEDLREKLKKEGFVQTKPETLYKRINAYFKGLSTKWMRVRDEGSKVCMTLKEYSGNAVDGMKEIEVEIDSFEKGKSLLEAMDLENYSYQETTREIWEKENIEIVFDQWPGLPLLIEIEGKSEEHVKEVASKLNLDWGKASFGGIGPLCEERFGFSIKELKKISEITFENPLKINTQK